MELLTEKSIALTVIFFAVVILHELAHIIYYRWYAKKFPSFHITWFGLTVGKIEEYRILTMRQHASTALAGIVVGWWVLAALLLIPYRLVVSPQEQMSIMLIYLLMCSLDFFNLFNFWMIKKEERDTLIGDIKTINVKTGNAVMKAEYE